MYTNPHIHKLLADERAATLRSESTPRKDPPAKSKRLRRATVPARGLLQPTTRRPSQLGAEMPSNIDTHPRDRSSGTEIASMLQSAVAGDSRAWDHLVAEFAGMMWAIARAHRLSDTDAADVSQSTWTKLFERVHQIRDPAAVGAWLATTARRESLRVIRASRRDVFMGDDVPDVASSDWEPGRELLLADRNETLWRCLGRLRPSDQSLLRLLMADPRPAYEEISAALDIPIGSIGPTRARALERLRNEIEREAGLSLIAD